MSLRHNETWTLDDHCYHFSYIIMPSDIIFCCSVDLPCISTYYMTNTTFSYEIVCNTLYELLFYLRYFDCHYFFLSVNCGMPAAPDNGSIVTVPSTLGGTEIIFRCNTGFVPTGNRTAVCSSDGISPNGTWTPDPATLVCIGK